MGWLALAGLVGCATEDAGVTGYEIRETPGDGEGRIQVVSDLPALPMRVRIDGEFLVRDTGGELEYAWITEPNSGFDTAIPAGDHVVELVDEHDEVWLTTGRISVTAGPVDPLQASPTWVVAWGERGRADYLAIDRLASDGDPLTVEVIAANRTARTVHLERCYGVADGPVAPTRWDCVGVHTVAPGERIAFVEPTELRRYPDRVENLYSRFADQPEHARMIAGYLAADIYATDYPVIGILARGAYPVPQDGGWDSVDIDVNWPAGPGPTDPL